LHSDKQQQQDRSAVVISLQHYYRSTQPFIPLG